MSHESDTPRDLAPSTLRLAGIQIRDPFVLTVAETGTYYLFGSTDKDIWRGPAEGFDCYRSADLEQWVGPIPAFRPPAGFWSDRNYWAPEVHAYDGRFFMFATFTAEGVRRGTQILVSDAPSGPYVPWGDGPVTPREWECLDGTLHVDEAGDPWIVFCHEWAQVWDGEIVAQRLSPDLSRAIGEPLVLFRASEAPWVERLRHPRVPEDVAAYVTDGPFLHRLASGGLIMLWSSFGGSGYAMGIARSASGRVQGPWVQEDAPIWARDGGHGMIARTLDGGLLLTLHQPNETPLERAVLLELEETAETVRPSPRVA
ncbi:glycoside hydrolase family 43 protein [Microbacterium ulmi]|uniref:Family 43 glycosylhydrolase n=1 Tax=Microbacterium ulmi TaxID=179095 RepID=A0A7Y2LZX8_9MICO|nr:glycoside hydrolase family 43 protein [Microbacterium ulmi]NII68922.1 beta-xylosidase [Microbacterium ulmi]NNH03905.1 family 43 glycosylhydrolase [Microbacterium ulmi]